MAKIKQLPFVAENVLNYPIGGLDYMCLRANYVWQRIARWLDVGAPAIPPPRKNIVESDDDQDDRINHKVFQSMKEFLPYVEKIKKLITILENKRSRVGNLFKFVDSNDVEKGIYFKGDADISISAEMEKVLCKILSNLISVKFSNTINVPIFKQRDKVPLMKPKRHKNLDNGSLSSIIQSNVDINAINTIVGSNNVGYLGHAIISGDFNRDGLIDIVYSAYGEGVKGNTPQSGSVYVFYGGVEHNGLKRSPQILNGDKLKQARFGWKLEALDLNLDGIDDLVVSAPLSSFKNAEIPVPFDSGPNYRCYGKVHVYFGQNNTGLSNGNRVTYFTNKSFSVLGSTLSKGDVDLDGNDDLIFGAPYSPSVNHAEPLTGSVYVVKASIAIGKKIHHNNNGKNKDTPIAYDISKIAYAVINGNSRYDLFGSAVVVDNNRMYIGAPGHRIPHKTNTSDTVTVGCVYGYKLPLPQDALPALQIIGNEILGEFGTGIAKSLNGNYLLVSAPASTLNSKVKQGGLIYVLNNIKAANGIIDLYNQRVPPSSKHNISTIASSTPFARFGEHLSMHDIDNNGKLDLLVSSPLYSGNALDFNKREIGALYIYKNFCTSCLNENLTSEDASIKLYGTTRGGRFGTSVYSTRNSSNNSMLFVSSPYASENNLEMNGIVEIYDTQ